MSLRAEEQHAFGESRGRHAHLAHRVGGEEFEYWRQPEPVDADLAAVVNARKTYWMSQIAIPGGKSFENFELNAAFHPG